MPNDDKRKKQCVDFAKENSDTVENRAISEPFVFSGDRVRQCVTCGEQFTAVTSRANAYSTACRRERQLRYGAAYRADIRQRRADILAKFGGHAPTRDDFLRLLQARKSK